MNRASWVGRAALFTALSIASEGCKNEHAKVDAAASASSASVTQFTKKPIGVGAKRTEATANHLRLNLTIAKLETQVDEGDATKRDEEVLEVAGDTVTKLKVTFSEDTKTDVENRGATNPLPTAIAGKTYVLVAKDGRMTVLTADEKAAPEAEASLVAKHYATFGKPDPIVAAMPDKAFKPGDDVPELAGAVAATLKSEAQEDQMDLEGVKVTFKDREGDTGVFNVDLTMRLAVGPVNMTLPLKGTMALRIADTRPTALTLEGPMNLELSDTDKEQGVKGGGSMRLSSTDTYP